MPLTVPSAPARRGLDYQLLKWRVVGQLLLNWQAAAHGTLGRMLARWPDDRYARSSRAHVAVQLGRRAEAVADLRAAVDSAGPAVRAADWFNLGFLLEPDDAVGAEDAFRNALALDPKLDRAWYGLGLALIRQQRLDEAVPALTRNTELQPMSPFGWYQLARVQMDRREPEAVRRIIRHLKGFEPKVAAQLEREVGHFA